MQLKFFSFLAVLTTLTLSICGTFALYQPAVAKGSQFFCKTATTKDGTIVPATIARTESGEEIPLILWISNYFSAVGGTPQNRCEEVSKRFQRYHDNGWLKYITTGIFNNYSVICVAKSVKSECLKSDIIVTLPPGIDRFDALSKLLDLNRIASGRPLYLTDDLIIYINGEAFINVEILIKRNAK
jgi:Circadian oscillating protein COP23